MGPPVMGCSGCANTLGAAGCMIHGTFSVSGALMTISHVHDWRVAGTTDQGVVLVCPHHDPPAVHLAVDLAHGKS